MLTKKQEKPAFDFVPYHYGSYSISANADLLAMEGKQLLSKVGKSYKKVDDLDYFGKLIMTDQIALREIEKNYANFTSHVVRHKYRDSLTIKTA